MTPAQLDAAVQATWDARRDIGDLAGAQSDNGQIIAWDTRTQTVRIGVYADKLTQSVLDAVTALVQAANPDDYGNAPIGGVVLIPPQVVSAALDYYDTVRVVTVITLDDGTLRDVRGACYP